MGDNPPEKHDTRNNPALDDTKPPPVPAPAPAPAPAAGEVIGLLISWLKNSLRNIPTLVPKVLSGKNAMQVVYTILFVFALAVLGLVIWLLLPDHGGRQPDKAESSLSTEDLPPWFSKWLMEGADKEQQIKISCKKTPREDGSPGYVIKCQEDGRDVGEDEWLKVHISKDGTGNRGDDPSAPPACLCCQTCTKPPSRNDTLTPHKQETTSKFTQIKQTISNVTQTIKETTTKTITSVKTTTINTIYKTTGIDLRGRLDCQHFSSTVSDSFEDKLRKLLEEEIEQLLKDQSVPKDKPCQDKWKADIDDKLRETFKNVLSNDLVAEKIRQRLESPSSHESNDPPPQTDQPSSTDPPQS